MKLLKMGQKLWVQLTDQRPWKKVMVYKTNDNPCPYYVHLEERGFRHNRIPIKLRQDPTMMYPHDSKNCQAKTQSAKEQQVSMSTLASENVPKAIDNPNKTAGPVTAEPKTPRLGTKEKEAEAIDPVQAEQNSHRRYTMVPRSDC